MLLASQMDMLLIKSLNEPVRLFYTELKSETFLLFSKIARVREKL